MIMISNSLKLICALCTIQLVSFAKDIKGLKSSILFLSFHFCMLVRNVRISLIRSNFFFSQFIFLFKFYVVNFINVNLHFAMQYIVQWQIPYYCHLLWFYQQVDHNYSLPLSCPLPTQTKKTK